MKIARLEDIEGMVFPTGRTTRVLIGPGSVEADRFVQGYVVIRPGGSVPMHSHDNEEVYTILEGSGRITVGDEKQEVSAICSIYLPPGQAHSLVNTGNEDLTMMFVYSPAGLVDHWADELEKRK